MSTSIVEKIESIRKETGLSQPDFAEKINVSINTYKSLLKRNGAPRFELIESIAAIWPQYSLWLLTDRIEPENDQIEPSVIRSVGITHRFSIVDSADARFMDKCAIKADAFKRLIFIQSGGNENDLAALITIDNGVLYKVSNNPDQTAGLWVSPGNINFASDGGGRTALCVFREWLMETDSDLVSQAELWELRGNYFDDVYKVLKIPVSALEPIKNEHLQVKFESWKKGLGY